MLTERSQNGVNFFFCYYLPLYFQAIHGFSAAQSGLYNLPLIFGACKSNFTRLLALLPRLMSEPHLSRLSGLFAIISGFLIARIGYYTLYMTIGSIMCTVAAGLLYTLDPGTPLAKAIGYQVLLGAGQGLAIQVPVIAGQAVSRPEDMSATTAIILCKPPPAPFPTPKPPLLALTPHKVFQMTGGAICISVGQSTFANRLLVSLRRTAPRIDASRVVAVGAADLRREIVSDQIGLVLSSYMEGLKDTFALGVALAGFAFVSSWVAPFSRLDRLGGAQVGLERRGRGQKSSVKRADDFSAS